MSSFYNSPPPKKLFVEHLSASPPKILVSPKSSTKLLAVTPTKESMFSSTSRQVLSESLSQIKLQTVPLYLSGTYKSPEEPPRIHGSKYRDSQARKQSFSPGKPQLGTELHSSESRDKIYNSLGILNSQRSLASTQKVPLSKPLLTNLNKSAQLLSRNQRRGILPYQKPAKQNNVVAEQ